MKKIIRIIFTIFIVLIVGLLLNGLIRTPIWIGESSDGNWTAVYERVFRARNKEYWDGTLYWNGDNNVRLKYTQFYVNGELHAGVNDPSRGQERLLNEASFVALGQREDKGNELKVALGWRHSGNEDLQEEEIILKRKRRFLPF
ncbi:uncharacterized protein DUF4944 [Natranaerovirga pectinivora]|uniref:Uncharacterized protein DUF4944 n=1 Tax=Natranaerovirga pectinivora TaxID=682400 RepID=A0A4R3MLE0_9FIRM|nr:DUF4944 domain-containing protein [Natranaerovirga pectinivora]TCT15516.1 uncharacterized protein DUF4944 [Natranaerovirga pectinivora]